VTPGSSRHRARQLLAPKPLVEAGPAEAPGYTLDIYIQRIQMPPEPLSIDSGWFCKFIKLMWHLYNVLNATKSFINM
jgi:hypothetical protein